MVFHEEDRVVLQGKDKRGVCSLVLKDIIEKIDGALEVCFWINMGHKKDQKKSSLV